MISHKKFFTAILMLLVLSISSCSFADEYKAGDVIVVLRNADSNVRVTASSFNSNGASSIKASEFAVAKGASLMKTYPELSEISNNIFALIHADNIDPEKFAQDLLNDPNVIAASPNYIVRAAAVIPDDTYISMLWGLDAVNMFSIEGEPSAWDKETGSSNVYVAIVDTGIDWTNPDLTNNVARSLGFTATGISSTQPGLDNNGHGTHVAGTIGAEANNGKGVAGINWYVRMIPVKVLDNRAGGTTDTVIEGMNYVAELLSEGYNIRAVNLSLETYVKMAPNQTNLVRYPMWRAFKAVDDYNKAVIVVAAGNHSVKIGEPATETQRESGNVVVEVGSYVYPASFVGLDNMISVSAMNASGNVASYSNTNADISAPGGDYTVDQSIIVSTWISNGAYTFDDDVALQPQQGTSMAAPHVSGAVALLSAHDSSMTAYQIKQCILESVGSGGEGLLDVYGALVYQESYGSLIDREYTENKSYEDWKSYNEDYSYDSGTYHNNDSSSGCNGLMLGAMAMIFVLPLARKLKS